jgi:hypothetical protein
MNRKEQYDLILKQGVKLAKEENAKRKAERAARPKDWTPTLVPFDQVAASALAPRPFTFERAWAQLACTWLTEKTWETFVWAVADEVKDFDGCVIGWIECMFDGMKLSDGSTVWH